MENRVKIKTLNMHIEKKPVVEYGPLDEEPEVIALFDRAREEDAEAMRQVKELLRDREWVNWLGDLGNTAEKNMIIRVSFGDTVAEAGILEFVNGLREELLGENSSVLEKLLVRRVINGWIAVHGLEVENARHNPKDREFRKYIDLAMNRAQRRYLEAIRELERVRQLRATRFLARVTTVSESSIKEETPRAEC